MTTVPSYLQDAKELLSQDGFATSDVWYTVPHQRY